MSGASGRGGTIEASSSTPTDLERRRSSEKTTPSLLCTDESCRLCSRELAQRKALFRVKLREAKDKQESASTPPSSVALATAYQERAWSNGAAEQQMRVKTAAASSWCPHRGSMGPAPPCHGATAPCVCRRTLPARGSSGAAVTFNFSNQNIDKKEESFLL